MNPPLFLLAVALLSPNSNPDPAGTQDLPPPSQAVSQQPRPSTTNSPETASSNSVPSPATDVDTLLDHLQANVVEYYNAIPSFFCSEHVISESEHPGFLNGSVHTVSDSRFRLRRKVTATKAVTLEESRVVDTIDGKAPRRQLDEADALGGPSLLLGGFSESLKLASALGRACFAYRLEPVRPGHEGDPLLLLFANLPKKSRGPNCPAYADIQGRASIDPGVMRVVRIQQTTHDYEIVPGIRGTWTWSVDYSPVLMGGKTFWLPRRTDSVSRADQSPARWRYTATYSDCHKLEVTSTMLSGETPVEAAPIPADSARPETEAPEARDLTPEDNPSPNPSPYAPPLPPRP